MVPAAAGLATPSGRTRSRAVRNGDRLHPQSTHCAERDQRSRLGAPQRLGSPRSHLAHGFPFARESAVRPRLSSCREPLRRFRGEPGTWTSPHTVLDYCNQRLAAFARSARSRRSPRGPTRFNLRRGLGPARPGAQLFDTALIAEPVPLAAVAGAVRRRAAGVRPRLAVRRAPRRAVLGARMFEPSAESTRGARHELQQRAAIERDTATRELLRFATSGA